MEWNYMQPVTIKFGNGIMKELYSIIKAKGLKSGLLVSDPFFIANGLAEKIVYDSEGLFKLAFGDLDPNPTVENVDNCAKVIRDNKIKFIVALGGGSSLDCAKAAGTIALTEDSITKYHGTGIQIPLKHLPLIAIPTTSGTGSEATCVSVLTDKKLGKKAPIVSDGFYPDLALIDPELTYSMPQKVTAQTGIDVLSHALEGFWSNNHQPICDALALHAAELVFKYLYKAYCEPNNIEAREKMAEASLVAGLAFSLPKTTASHACSFPLTNIYHIPHGEACGLTLDYFARINGALDNGRINNFAVKLGFVDVAEMADEIHRLKEKLGLMNDLKKLNLTDENIDELIKISRHPNLYNNPVEITDGMLLEMYNSFR